MLTYKETLDYIYNLNIYGIKLGLQNITLLLSLLGNPHKEFKIIHIAGTNGKGSTAAMISFILQAQGFKVGLYTSPHLVDFAERMKINYQSIEEEKIGELLKRVMPYIEKVAHTPGYSHPTFFEVITAMAFLYFYNEKVDFLVLEVGLGGRLDATNVCQPLISVITKIDYDHMDKLGSNLTEIAREKGGIIKSEGIVITSKQNDEAYSEIRKISIANKCRIFSVGKEINYEILKSDIKGSLFNLKGIYSEFKNLYIPLLGRHQVNNAATAVAAIEALRIKKIKISKRAIIEGLEKVKWEGRLEIIQNNPLLILDGAHNPNGIRVVREALEDIFFHNRLILVLGIFSDKDYKQMIQIISPIADLLITTKAQNPRATPPQIIAQEAAQYLSQDKIMITDDVPEAINLALQNSCEGDLICITGSLYTVGEAKNYFKRKDHMIS